MMVKEYDKFLKHIEEMYSTSRVNNIKVVYKNLLDYSVKENIEIKNMSKEDILSFLKTTKSRGYGGLQTKISAVKDITKYYTGSEVNIKITEIKEDNLVYDDRYFDEEEIEDLANLLINPQDKAIVLLLFYGVMGKGYEELINLKVSDIDLDNRTIKLKDRNIYMNDVLYDVIKDTIYTEKYYKYIDEKTIGNTNKSYLLNSRCEYLLKPKNFSKNNHGLNAFKLSGLQRRLCKLSEVTNSKLTGKSLVVSGTISKIKEDGIKTTVVSIEDWLNKNNINLQAYEVYRIFNAKFVEKELSEIVEK